jgi:hypothetical protein
MRDAATAALARLNAHLPLDAKVGTLAVAQRQIVAICCGLVANGAPLWLAALGRLAALCLPFSFSPCSKTGLI